MLPFTATALLVIDAQESFRQRPYWSHADAQGYFDRQQALIDGALARKLPVIQILHVRDGDELFSPASGHVRTLQELSIVPTVTFQKYRHSAFVGTGLDVWLTQHGIRRLIVSGIRTEQCCETTARHASDVGYEVDFVTEATLTFPMQSADGRTFSPSDIKTRTELVLTERFARIVSVEDALADATARQAA